VILQNISHIYSLTVLLCLKAELSVLCLQTYDVVVVFLQVSLPYSKWLLSCKGHPKIQHLIIEPSTVFAVFNSIGNKISKLKI